MNSFTQRFSNKIKGVISGFDRSVFKGCLRPIAYADGAMAFLRWRGVLNKNYKPRMMAQSKLIVEHADRYARKTCGQGVSIRPPKAATVFERRRSRIPMRRFRTNRIPMRRFQTPDASPNRGSAPTPDFALFCGKFEILMHEPIASSNERKEAIAHQRQRDLGIKHGLIGVWYCVEVCSSFRAHYDAQAGFPQLRHLFSRCKHLYFYYDHPLFGFMSVRLQTWFPCGIQIAFNNRFMDQMAAVKDTRPFRQILDALLKPRLAGQECGCAARNAILVYA